MWRLRECIRRTGRVCRVSLVTVPCSAEFGLRKVAVRTKFTGVKNQLKRIETVESPKMMGAALAMVVLTFWATQSERATEMEQKAVQVKDAVEIGNGEEKGVQPEEAAKRVLVVTPRVSKREKLPAKELKRRYRLGEVLGEGTFAVVRLAVDKKSKDKVAIKEISKELSEVDALENEIHIMEATGKHENIVSLRDVFDSKDVLYLVMDLAEGGELFDRIIERGELSEQTASRMFLSAVRGVQHLHKHKIAHLDIKPENLLLTSKTDEAGIKIADFGLAIDLSSYFETTVDESHHLQHPAINAASTADEKVAFTQSTASGSSRVLNECVGTPAYWAPEMVKNEPFDEKVDIWALGCVLYIMLCGAHPFDPMGDATEAQILAQVAKGEYDKASPQYLDISSNAKDLIRHMLDPNPASRYSATQLLKHPWLAEQSSLSAEPLSKDHITRLRGFRIIRLLRQGMQHLLGSAASDLFAVFDADGDGFISPEELQNALELIGQRVTKREVEVMMRAIDGNQDGKISREEFDIVLRAPPSSPYSSLRHNRTSIEDIEFLFRIFDRDRDGYIEHSDLQHILGLLGASVTASTLSSELSRIVIDKDQKIDFAAFVQYWRMMEKERFNSASGPYSSSLAVPSPMHMKHRRTRLHAHNTNQSKSETEEQVAAAS